MRVAHIAIALVAGLTCFLTPACANLPSVRDEGASPRRTTAAAIETTIGVFDKMTIAATAGALPDNFLDDVGQYAPSAEEIATGYLDATAACINIDGALQSDPATGRACEKSAVKRAFGDLSALVADAVQRVGPATDAGRAILVASLLLDRQLRPASGDVWTGYEKRADLTLDEFNGYRTALKASFDRFVAASAAALAAQKR